MSLYNMLFGRNPNSAFLRAVLNMTEGDFGRFRDVWVTEGTETDGPRILVYTRLGGGNRECYCDDGAEHSCYQSTIAELQAHPLYVTDFDDDFDCTYASFEFKVPEHMKAVVRTFMDESITNPKERWEKLLDGLRQGNTNDPTVARALDVGQQIMGAINESLAGKDQAGS